MPETETNKKYVLLYDFDKNCVAEEIAEKISKKQKQRSGRFLKQKSVTKYVQILGRWNL